MKRLTGPVVKVGGSLLGEPNLVPLLRSWLARQNPTPAALVAGGGQWVDGIRAADQRFALGEEAAHWLSVRAMRLTALLLSKLLPEARYTTDLAEVGANSSATLVLDVEGFLQRDEPRVEGTPLPHCWGVTSDSIAARIAIAVGSEELVLLKSSLPPRGTSLGQAAEMGYVDCFLPTVTKPLARVRCVNLRGPHFPEELWKPRRGDLSSQRRRTSTPDRQGYDRGRFRE